MKRPQLLELAWQSAVGVRKAFNSWERYYKREKETTHIDSPFHIRIDFVDGVFTLPGSPLLNATIQFQLPECMWRNFIFYFGSHIPSCISGFWCYYPTDSSDFDFMKNFAYHIVKDCGKTFNFVDDEGNIIQP